MRLLVVGAGGHAKVVVDAARAAGHDVVCVIGRPGDPADVLGAPVVNDPKGLAYDAFIVAVGDNRLRMAEFDRWRALGLAAATVVHPSAMIARTATLDAGTLVAAGVIVNPDAHIGGNVILNTGCTVDHDCLIGDHAHIGPGTNLCGGVGIGEGALTGVGSCVIPGGTVGAWATIGAGATVTHDVPDGEVWAGVPARPLGESETTP